VDATVSIHNPLTALSGVTDREARGRGAPLTSKKQKLGPFQLTFCNLVFFRLLFFCVISGWFHFF